jgi:dihydrofolate reductase
MRITIIAALDVRHAIGKDNAMPWRLPDDLKRFRQLTMGKPIAMGRMTAESIGGPLPGRRNLVITRSGVAPFPGQEPVASLDEAIKAAGDVEELIIAGGGQIYAQALPIADRAVLTWVDTELDGADTHFPDFPTPGWTEVAREWHDPDARHAFGFSWADYMRGQGSGV